MLRATPPPSTSKAALEVWLCERHNEVNRRKNKALFNCTLDHLRRRYVQTDGCPLD